MPLPLRLLAIALCAGCGAHTPPALSVEVGGRLVESIPELRAEIRPDADTERAAPLSRAREAITFHQRHGLWVGMIGGVPVLFEVEMSDDTAIAVAPAFSPAVEVWATPTYIAGRIGSCTYSLEGAVGGLTGSRACVGTNDLEPVFVRLVRPVGTMTAAEIAALVVLLYPTNPR